MALPELQGRALLLTVTVLTSLGFMLIGFDNGLMGGLGEFAHHTCRSIGGQVLTMPAHLCLVNSPAFNTTFNTPNATMIGVIVAIFEGK